MLCGGVSRIVSIDLGTILGHLWMLFGGVAGRNEHTMGIRGSEMAFLRPPYRGDSGQSYNVGGVP